MFSSVYARLAFVRMFGQLPNTHSQYMLNEIITVNSKSNNGKSLTLELCARALQHLFYLYTTYRCVSLY